MKKLLLIAAFAAVVPFCADAASPVFDDAGAFTVAKAVKLGRGKAYKINGGQSFGKGGFDETKSCCAHCANCNTKTGECTACETGFELKNGSCVEKQCDEHCTSCSKGTCYDCESGYELNDGKCEKIACGAGTYEKNGSCVSICTGVTCNTAKGFQTVAYDGSCCCERGSCSAGQYLNGTSCVSCPKGSYSKGGSMTACISCPSGKTTDSTGATSASECHTPRTPCKPGTYVKNGACMPCPGGTYSAGSDAASCVKCPAGTYAAAGSTSCTKCQTGADSKEGASTCYCVAPYKSVGNNSCVYCPNGQHWVTDVNGTGGHCRTVGSTPNGGACNVSSTCASGWCVAQLSIHDSSIVLRPASPGGSVCGPSGSNISF